MCYLVEHGAGKGRVQRWLHWAEETSAVRHGGTNKEIEKYSSRNAVS